MIVRAVAALGLMLVTIWPGYFVLRAAGLVSNRWPAAIFASPPLTVAIALIGASSLAWLSIPMNLAGSYLADLLGLLGIAGFVLFLRERAWPRELVLIALVFTLPLILLPCVILTGIGTFGVSTANDGWSYIAVADYLQHVPRGEEGDLIPLHQYAAHLARTRNGSSALMAMLASATHTRPHDVANTYCLILCFAYCSALAALALTDLKSTFSQATFVIVASYPVAFTTMFFANVDQMLLALVLPAMAAVLLSPAALWWRALIFGILASAAVYAYAEMAAVGVAAALSVVFTTKLPWRETVKTSTIVTLISAPVIALLISSYIPYLIPFLKSQFATTQGPVRPGDHFFDDWPMLRIELVLAAMLMLGAIHVTSDRSRWASIASIFVITTAAIYFLAEESYPYAAYKFLSVGMWLIALYAVKGVEDVSVRLDGPWLLCLRTSIILLIAVLAGSSFYKEARLQFAIATQQIRFKEITKVGINAPTAFNVSNPAANQWGVYYLSSVPLAIDPLEGYMGAPHVAWLMARARKVDNPAFAVTDPDATLGAAEVHARLPSFTVWKLARVPK